MQVYIRKETPYFWLVRYATSSRHMICRRSKLIGFAFDDDTSIPDGQDTKDFRPDGAFIKTLKSKDLDAPGVLPPHTSKASEGGLTISENK